ncbi:hypothetical protein GDO86_003624 [Hymenochirus boettgeri]|uniref:Uncharacterized protein n=1 Tax=Hymenochirus boettgeri TaxID=247094 RepID=A0A8T2K1T5_9PIPI|nr:hypothetical protein GDO86_003624 [Hymenochirus boettgeri]
MIMNVKTLPNAMHILKQSSHFFLIKFFMPSLIVNSSGMNQRIFGGYQWQAIKVLKKKFKFLKYKLL